ncbi:MAG: gluconate 2-dehydrogenase gamma chain [Gaiellales bacterium]|jgi:gluconate 2-dehydrogenase gamma chain|nr:gluconate 2-dehydrogenase gamma chain [Gaiellales bacterium]
MGDKSSGEERQAGLSRAQLVRRAGMLGAAAALPGAAAAPAVADAAASDALKALTAAEAATLDAVLQRLLPTDAAGPGAKEANVLRYIDWALAGDLNVFRGPYASALAAIDAYAVQTFGAAFAALTAAQQDQLLSNMEAGAPEKSTINNKSNPQIGFAPSSTAVFEMIRTHALQGMFGDPAHGGNVGFVGWNIVRFPGPRLVVPKHEQELDVVPKQQLKSTYQMPLFKKTKHTP